MIKFLIKILLATILVVFIGAPAYGAVSSTSLIENAKQHSGNRVAYKGEAIGDIMKRGSHGWVNLHDGNNAIGVWAPMEMLQKIKFTGDYNHSGDIVLVEGVFDQACDEHGGDIDIHAESLEIIQTGKRVDHTLSNKKAVTAGILSLVAIILFAVNKYQKRHFIAP